MKIKLGIIVLFSVIGLRGMEEAESNLSTCLNRAMTEKSGKIYCITSPLTQIVDLTNKVVLSLKQSTHVLIYRQGKNSICTNRDCIFDISPSTLVVYNVSPSDRISPYDHLTTITGLRAKQPGAPFVLNVIEPKKRGYLLGELFRLEYIHEDYKASKDLLNTEQPENKSKRSYLRAFLTPVILGVTAGLIIGYLLYLQGKINDARR